MNEYNDWVYKSVGWAKILALFIAFGLGFLIILHKTEPPQAPKQTATIKVMVAPASASAKLNGKDIKNGTHTVQPGKYTLVITKPGFASQTKTQDVAANSTVFLGGALESNSPSTANWYQENPDDQRLAEGVNGAASDASSQNATYQTPIVNKLPVTLGAGNYGFKIDFGIPAKGAASDAPTIYIRASTLSARASAMSWIKYSGYDPSTMNIQFIGTINPFIKPEASEGYRGE